MYKIAHISDIHIKNAGHIHFEIFNKLLKNIKINKVDHIFLTGDIADYGIGDKLKLVKNTFKKYGYYDKNKLSVIPGNHDIYGGPSDKYPPYMYIKHCRDLDFDKTEKSFVKQFAGLSGKEESVYLKFLNNIAVIGINSIYKWDIEENPTGTNGYVYKSEINKLVSLLKRKDVKDKIKVILIHHHFNEAMFRKDHIEHRLWLKSEEDRMQLYNKKELMKIFERYNVKFVFHGHTHITESYKIGKTTYVNSSGCTRPITKEQERNYHILTIDNNKIKLDKIAV